MKILDWFLDILCFYKYVIISFRLGEGVLCFLYLVKKFFFNGCFEEYFYFGDKVIENIYLFFKMLWCLYMINVVEVR